MLKPIHRSALRYTLIPLMAILLSACGGGRPIHYYTVELPPTPEPSTSVYPITLLIGRIGSPEIMEDEAIVYRSGPNSIGTYDYHHWVEPPVRMLKVVLFRRLRASGKYQSVADLGSAAQGDYVLQGRLYDFEEVDTGGSIAALVSMEFELLDRRTRKTVWTHFYSRTVPVQGKQISDVVAALDHNLSQGLDEIADGLNTYFSANLPAKSQAGQS
jgi:ABC-type uncharacterized transport system auxiliary subunit